jgi:hypothetical protein
VPELHIAAAADRLLEHLAATEQDVADGGSMFATLARIGAETMMSRVELDEADHDLAR